MIDRSYFQTGSKTRVLINAIHARSGGGITYLRNMLPILAEDDRLELHLFLDATQFQLFNPIDERIRVHLFDLPKSRLGILTWEQTSLPCLAHLMYADVIFSPANYGPVLARNTIIVLRNALAVVGQETRFTMRLYWAGLALMTFVSLLACRQAIAVSNYARRTLKFLPIRRLERKISVVYHGVNPIYLQPVSPAVQREFFILIVADIYVQKNLHNFLRALAVVREHHPDIRLKIAGRRVDQGYYEQLCQIIEEVGLTSNVLFLGEQSPEELAALYRSCAIMAFPSTVETFGLPLIEAMGSGTPIACSRRAAMPEIVGDAALLFDPLDVEDMAAAILKLISDKDLQNALTQRALKRSRYFSWARTARETADILVGPSDQPASSGRP